MTAIVQRAEQAVAALRAMDKAATRGPWRWVNPDTDIPCPNPGGESQTFRVSLRTVDEYPTRLVGPLPMFILDTVSYEQETSADACLIAAARAWPSPLADLIEGVIERHKPLTVQTGSRTHGGGPEFGEVCRYEVGHLWPCPDMLALVPLIDAILGGTP